MAQQGLDGPIKIGCCAGPALERIRQLQTGNSEHIRLLVTIPRHLATEARLMARFADDRLGGEWFQASRALVSFANEAICAVAALRGVTVEARRLANVSRTAVRLRVHV